MSLRNDLNQHTPGLLVRSDTTGDPTLWLVMEIIDMEGWLILIVLHDLGRAGCHWEGQNLLDESVIVRYTSFGHTLSPEYVKKN